MYKIGEFAKLTGASIRTLRYYDEIDLLKPDNIDLFTGYRYYSEKQLKDYKLILDLKDIGFSLDEIIKSKDRLTDEILLNKKEELLLSQNDLNRKIKKLDMMRSTLSKEKLDKPKVLTREERKWKTLKQFY